MKRCPVCALELEDSFLFCPDDGSSLPVNDDLSRDAVGEPSTPADAGDGESSPAVVLYCPTCAAEYPLTFSECPVHGLRLTEHKVPVFSKRLALVGTDTPLRNEGPRRLTRLNLERPEIESPSHTSPVVASPAGIDLEQSRTSNEPTEFFGDSTEAESDGDSHEIFSVAGTRGENRGFRIAAIATVIVLAVLGLAAMFSFFSHISRRSTPPRVAREDEIAQAFPLVTTPQEAQDYKEPEPAAVTPGPPEPAAHPRDEKKHDDTSTPRDRIKSNNSIAQIPSKPPVQASPPPSRPAAASSAPPSPLPRGNAGFDARLLRVRSSRTPSGFRYDLTFSIQEQGGHSANWQRLLISSRSASGISHSQALPFTHRLGATGALTFTVSVEMKGHSESDWQGRVVCTTLGWDNQGAPLQTSFGANVTP